MIVGLVMVGVIVSAQFEYLEWIEIRNCVTTFSWNCLRAPMQGTRRAGTSEQVSWPFRRRPEGERISESCLTIFWSNFTSNGSSQKSLILMTLITRMTANIASTAFLLKNFSANVNECKFRVINQPAWHDLLIFFLNNRAKSEAPLLSTSVFGMYSSFAMMPLPSIDLGEILNVAPSNIISGSFTSMLCVTINLTPLSYRALDTSSIGAAWSREADL